jgi:hypothetical protein
MLVQELRERLEAFENSMPKSFLERPENHGRLVSLKKVLPDFSKGIPDSITERLSHQVGVNISYYQLSKGFN